jgi:hypothetical protein
MKRLAISVLVALSAGAAHADPVTVLTPRAGASVEEKTAYIVKLDKAVKEVCYRAATPVVGVNYYAYLACLKRTRAAVGETEPTGLYAARDSGGAAMAAK